MSAPGPVRARSDAANWLVEADEPLAGLQLRCGGRLPGPIAIPGLLALVRKARRARLPLSRSIVAVDEGRSISAWVSVRPTAEMTFIEASQWRPTGEVQPAGELQPDEDLLRQLAEGDLLLDGEQRVLAADLRAADLQGWSAAVHQGLGRFWTDFVRLDRAGQRQPLHWRLLDDATFTVPGSMRRWRARILPQGGGGFELLVIPEAIDRLPHELADTVTTQPAWNSLLGRDLAPALRQPITRIIANAETIRTRLAGPLVDEYVAYANDIAEAGRHLMGLIEDLADLEAVEASDFSPAPDHIDLADCARRAAGILSVRAQESGIVVECPGVAESAPAIGEFRRVLQVLLNLLSNALRYTPGGSTVRIAVGSEGATAWVSVADEGEGLTEAQAGRVFDKFERLGRSGDGGSGLGLYISRRLAKAMGGDLRVAPTPGEGACFILSLPADRAGEAAVRAAGAS
ncbi:sensor histidine kinase [Novosphingobium huizhouense]|uniref:sensor histidine kinase n=1 Tax=Novosphingobium huizhouense TaxID=2866625 RepID=UPI001CD838E2|nr:HAMP domain-containing sensor histidine kinase [Novosphingobium huizhouense]